MISYNTLVRVILAAIPFVFIQCSGSRAITNSGKVTAKGKVQVGSNLSGNIPTNLGAELYKIGKEFYTSSQMSDSLLLDMQTVNAQKALYAYSIDPLSAGFDFFVRYGLVKNIDIGYKNALGAHKFDGQYQFLGKNCKWTSSRTDNFNGSVGLQYIHSSYKLPSYFHLDDIQELLGFKYTKNDILIPVIFSKSFGEDEKIGRFAFGAVYGHSFMKYIIVPVNIYDENNMLVHPEEHKENYNSFGGFINVKVGYKYAYLHSSLSMYYQNYGDYKLLTGQNVNYRGLTIVPTIGLHFTVGKWDENNSPQ